MSTIAHGYGSKEHLSHFLKSHRNRLNEEIRTATGGEVVEWLAKPCDAEWRGVEFEGEPIREAWKQFWPQNGNTLNWDAVGKIRFGKQTEWLLVEAKAQLGELKSSTRAKQSGGLSKIEEAFTKTKEAFGVADTHNWLKPCYQFCNRLAAHHFLRQQQKASRLLFIYFLGDEHPRKHCPKSEDEWHAPLQAMYDHVGLTWKSPLEKRIHRIFLHVCDSLPPNQSL